jgi:hypothetical protein
MHWRTGERLRRQEEALRARIGQGVREAPSGNAGAVTRVAWRVYGRKPESDTRGNQHPLQHGRYTARAVACTRWLGRLLNEKGHICINYLPAKCRGCLKHLP